MGSTASWCLPQGVIGEEHARKGFSVSPLCCGSGQRLVHDAADRETIGTYAAESVRPGFTVMVLHQRFFNLMLDELEQEALAVQS